MWNRFLPPSTYDLPVSGGTSLALVVLLCGLFAIGGCRSFSPGPAEAVRALLRHLEAGELEAAAGLTSARTTPDEKRRELAGVTALIRDRGGVRVVEITSERTTGDLAEVVARVTYGSGGTAVVRYRLLRTNGTWTVDEGRDEPQINERNRGSQRCDSGEGVTKAAMIVAAFPLSPFTT